MLKTEKLLKRYALPEALACSSWHTCDLQGSGTPEPRPCGPAADVSLLQQQTMLLFCILNVLDSDCTCTSEKFRWWSGVGSLKTKPIHIWTHLVQIRVSEGFMLQEQKLFNQVFFTGNVNGTRIVPVIGWSSNKLHPELLSRTLYRVTAPCACRWALTRTTSSPPAVILYSGLRPIWIIGPWLSYVYVLTHLR